MLTSYSEVINYHLHFYASDDVISKQRRVSTIHTAIKHDAKGVGKELCNKAVRYDLFYNV